MKPIATVFDLPRAPRSGVAQVGPGWICPKCHDDHREGGPCTPDPVPGTIEHSFAQVVARLEAARAEIPKMHYPDFEASPPPSGWRDPHARAEGGLQIAGLPDAPKPPEKVNRLDAIKNVAPPDPTKIDPAKFPGGIVPTKMPPRRMFGKMPGRGR